MSGVGELAEELAAVRELVAALMQALVTGGANVRTGTVTAVNAGPPRSVDLTLGDTTVTDVRYLDSYSTPLVNDVVVLAISKAGGSGRGGGRERGGAPIVLGLIAF